MWAAQVLTCVVLFYAFSSGIAWRVLHFFWIVSWLAPLLLLPVLSKLNRQVRPASPGALPEYWFVCFLTERTARQLLAIRARKPQEVPCGCRRKRMNHSKMCTSAGAIPTQLCRFCLQAAASRAAAQAAAAQRQQQQQRQAGPRPFAGWNPFGAAASKAGGGCAAQQPGPVIDAEWETIDEGDH